MVEHVHPYVDDEHEITCPYCGSPLMHGVRKLEM